MEIMYLYEEKTGFTDVAINGMETYQLDNHQPLILWQLQSQSWACQAFWLRTRSSRLWQHESQCPGQ